MAALNRRLWAWVEGEYHQQPHRGLDAETPLERWARTAETVRWPEPELDLDALFLFEAQRKVQKERTVSLNGLVYEVDAALVRDKVTLRYDPDTAQRRIQVHHQGQFIALAKPVDLYANCFVKRDRSSSPWNLATEASAPTPSPSRRRLAAHRDDDALPPHEDA